MMRPRGAARELYQSVMDAITARENIEINGGDDIDDGIHISHTPLPTDVNHMISKSSLND